MGTKSPEPTVAPPPAAEKFGTFLGAYTPSVLTILGLIRYPSAAAGATRAPESWLRIMRALSKIHKSTLITRLNWIHEPGQRQRIVVWWGGLENNGDMMLLLAHLLKLNPEWSDARIVVRSIARSEKERRFQEQGLRTLLEEVRIEAETDIIKPSQSQTIAELIRERSAGSSIVFLGMKDPAPGAEAEYAQRLEELASGLCTTVFVRNAGKFAGDLV